MDVKRQKAVFILMAFATVFAALYAIGYAEASAVTACCVLIGLLGIALVYTCREKTEKFLFIPFFMIIGVVVLAATNVLSIGIFKLDAFENNVWVDLFAYFWIIAPMLLFYGLTGRLFASTVLGSIVWLIIGLAHYCMLLFRGRLFLALDVYALRTAANVASTYSLEVTGWFVAGILMMVMACAAAFTLGKPINKPTKKFKTISRAVCGALALGFTFLFYFTYILDYCGITVVWNDNDFERSPVLSFMISIEDASIKQPEGYSNQKLEEIISDVDNDSKNEYKSKEDMPHIICIMSESLTNQHVVGEIETNEEVLPYILSLMETTVHGYLNASTIAGGTANSEYEFLTGNSMAFIPSGSTPYQLYIHYPKDTLVSVLEDQGYSSIMLHPYYSTGWNRVEVYQQFGFDDVNFIEDFVGKKYLRKYVSDASNYENIIRKFENRQEGEKLFIFNITMQNHGSYTYKYYQPTISIADHEGEFPETEQYLSVLHVSDGDTENLINYFSEVDEPVIILLFGDHHPRLKEEYWNMILGKTADELTQEEYQKKYLTPFFIWSNYGLEAKDMGTVSINYLSSILLDYAGLEMSDFQSYLYDLKNTYPVINAQGYVDADGNHYVSGDETVEANLEEYKMLQYNYLFDTNGYMDNFFGIKE